MKPTTLQLPVHRRADGREYVPLTPWQAFELDVREGGRLIAHTKTGDVLDCELQLVAGELVVHAWAGWPHGIDSVRVRAPRQVP